MTRPDEDQLFVQLDYILQTNGVLEIPAGVPDSVIDRLMNGDRA